MRQQIIKKLDAGFHCIKLKIGAIDFEAELDLLRMIRSQFSKELIELRVDANGAFSPKDAPRKLEQLAKYDIHSIEQPIRQGQWEEMSRLCRNTPIPIALDEELIGIEGFNKDKLLDTIRPQYVVIKPSLLGSFSGSWEWISRSRERNIGWWITSALESNIGLNAIGRLIFWSVTPRVCLKDWERGNSTRIISLHPWNKPARPSGTTHRQAGIYPPFRFKSHEHQTKR